MTQTGVRTVNIRGKEYVDVAERVRLCNADQGFSMLCQERYQIEGRHFFSVTILVKDKQYIGDAEIKFGAPKNSPDGTNPVECAQTSALGRALGFAGYGTLESIASADEVLRALAEESNPTPRPQQTMTQAGKITPAQLSSIKNLCRLLGREVADGTDLIAEQTAKEEIAILSKQWKAKQFKDAQKAS
jgi:hypothetical protein